MDTVVGKRGTQSCLLVLTERKSRLQIIRKLKNKTMIEVVGKGKEIIKSYLEAIKTITSDNGSGSRGYNRGSNKKNKILNE